MISFIISIYNIGKYLEECLNSITDCKQLMDICEVILIDDASPDNSSEVYEPFLKKYTNFKLIKYPQNKGLALGRNDGLKMATKKYVYFIDGDDFIYPEVVLKMLDLCEKYGHDFVVSNNHRFNEFTKTFEDNFVRIPFITSMTEDIPFTTLQQTPLFVYETTVWNKVISKKFLQEHNIQDIPYDSYYEDYYFSLLIMLNARTFGYINDVGYCWRINPTSITCNEQDIRKGKDRLKMINEIFPHILNSKENIKNLGLFRIYNLDIPLVLRFINKYPPSFVDEFMETVYPWLLQTPKEFLIIQPSYYQEVYQSILNQDKTNFKRLIKVL